MAREKNKKKYCVYDVDVFKEKCYLLSHPRTGFAISYLFDVTLNHGLIQGLTYWERGGGGGGWKRGTIKPNKKK